MATDQRSAVYEEAVEVFDKFMEYFLEERSSVSSDAAAIAASNLTVAFMSRISGDHVAEQIFELVNATR